MRARSLLLIAPLLLLLPLLAACGDAESPAADDAAQAAEPRATATRAAAAYLTPQPEPAPVRFPEDEAPHDMLTEWWYYTGHLFTATGERYGFEYVFFQAQRGAFPSYYAAHFAITDNPRGAFHYDEKFGPDAVRPTDAGFHLALGSWSMRGALGEDLLVADMDGYAIDLQLSATKPPALHGGTGYVEFGPAGGSYYYSRTRMAVDGTLTVGGEPLAVTGEAWMDHQWGNFIQVGSGGWDWFSAQLDNGEDLTISLIRAEDGTIVMSYGTLVRADGEAVHLEMGDFEVTVTDTWTSTRTGATYPSRWTIALPAEGWTLDVVPTMNDQELVTTESTGVIYWEGEVLLDGSERGHGYVELTGYADGLPADTDE